MSVGINVGLKTLGLKDGFTDNVGIIVGFELGTVVESKDVDFGSSEGLTENVVDGYELGAFVTINVGPNDGDAVVVNVGVPGV